MGALNPYEFPNAWGKIILSGYTLPGVVVSVDGVVRAYDWVVQKGTDKSGAASVYRGEKLTEEMTIELEAPRKEHFDDLVVMFNTVIPQKGQKPPTLNVVNPIFSFVRITRIAVKEYGIKPSAGLSWRVTTKWIEYNPPAPTKTGQADPAKPDAKKPGAAPTKVEELQQQADALAKKLIGP